MPKFVLKMDMSEDIILFQKYLCDKDTINTYPFIKNSIFRVFPDLKNKLENESMESNQLTIIGTFVESIYDKNKNKITQINANLEKQISNFSDVIYENIAKIMSYDFEKDSIYEIYLSLFPFSTYWNNRARVSILDDVWWYKNTPFVGVIVHELSHVILQEQFDKRKIKTSSFSFNMLKEIFAPILLRRYPLKEIIQSEELLKGNPELYFLQIKKGNKIYNIVNYFEEIYLWEMENWKKFYEIMGKLLHILESNENILKGKESIFKMTHKWEYMWSIEFMEKLENAHYLDPINLI